VKQLKTILTLFLGTLILLSPALYNGYPLVYSDTGTYIFSGMELTIPLDRPIGYGLFLRYTSLFGASLWYVIFFQSLIGAYLLYLTIRLSVHQHFNVTYLIILSFLTYFTALGWYAGQLMPDIFSAYLILGVFLLFHIPLRSFHFMLISLIIIIGLMVHFSNSLILLLIIALIVATQFRRLNMPKFSKRISLVVIALLIISTASLKLINYSLDKDFTINRSGHVFLMGKLLDSGLLEQFLAKKCADNKSFPMCEFRETLPSNSRELLWGNESPLQHYGGWVGSKTIFDEIIFSFLSSPEFVLKLGVNIMHSTLSQLFQNDMGSGLVSQWYASPDSPPAFAIANHFEHEYSSYQQARQNGNLWGQQLDFEIKNVFNSLLLFLSVSGLLLFWVLVRKNKGYIIEKTFSIIIVGGIIINALVTAGLANVYDRLQARVSWLFVLLFLISAFPYLLQSLRLYSKDR
jgi:hypothetical protein